MDYHQRVVTILNALRSDFLIRISAYFGGGTLLTLSYGEYRQSKDIDFICPVGDGYRMLRSEIFDKSYKALFADDSTIVLPRRMTADQYGVRFAVKVEDIPIKFEIVAEARILLEPPEFHSWSDVPCLSFGDACAEKLLSNSDRWADRGVESRDLIDLSILRRQGEFPTNSIEKAESAYPVLKPLEKSIRSFQSDRDYRCRCFSSLGVNNRADVVDGLDLIAGDLGIDPTERQDGEYPDL